MVGGVGMHHGVIFNFGSAKVCSAAIFETCFSFLYFYIIVLFSLTAVLHLIKFYSFINFSLPINAVILLLNYLV